MENEKASRKRRFQCCVWQRDNGGSGCEVGRNHISKVLELRKSRMSSGSAKEFNLIRFCLS